MSDKYIPRSGADVISIEALQFMRQQHEKDRAALLGAAATLTSTQVLPENHEAAVLPFKAPSGQLISPVTAMYDDYANLLAVRQGRGYLPNFEDSF